MEGKNDSEKKRTKMPERKCVKRIKTKKLRD